MPNRSGSIRLFRFAGINVFLHWSWFIVALFQVNGGFQVSAQSSSLATRVSEYLALFVIVLLHEFGHALACRSVGGRADQIVLWPLGGVAYVDPPPRPGATLWSIVAGPLVNVLLIPGLSVALVAARMWNWPVTNPNLYEFIEAVWFIDVGLFCFNVLPIYPLDGGQILRSLLWFFLGRARSLLVASGIGFVATILLLVYVIPRAENSTWLVIVAAFVLMNCWAGWRQARALGRLAAAPRRTSLACPHCKASPPAGNYWGCGRCRAAFDIFATHGVCPNCGTIFNDSTCMECGRISPLRSFGDPNA